MNDLRLIQINLYHVFLLFLVLTINPIIGGNIEINSFISLLLLVCSTTLLGSFINNYLNLVKTNSFANIFLSFLIGSSLFIISLPMLNGLPAVWAYWFNIVIFLLMGITVYLKRKKVKLSFEFDLISSVEILLLVLVFCYFLGVPEYISSTSLGSKDGSYFTTIVASLNSNPIFLTLNETGSHINYQIVSFLTPAVLAKLAHVSSHVALWNMTMPFYLILFGVVLSEVIRSLTPSSSNKKILAFLSIFIFIGLMPLHLKNLAALQWLDLYLPGMGALLPGGNPPVSLAMSMALIIILFLFQKDFKNTFNVKHFIFLALLTALILPIKKAAFPSMAVFVVIFYFLTTKQVLKSILLSACIIVIGYISLKISVPISGASKVVFSPGFLIEYYGKTQSWIKNSLITATFLFTFLFAKLLIFLYYRFKFEYDQKIINLTIASILALVISLIMPLLLRAYVIDNDGRILQDMTFDTLQFPRFGFFLLTLVAVITTWTLLHAKQHNFFKIIMTSYIVVVSFSVLNFSFSNNSSKQRLSYYDEVETELDKHNAYNQLYAAFANDQYLAQVFVADDYGGFFASSNRASGGYAMTVEHIERWYLMAKIEDALVNGNVEVFKEKIAQLKTHNVEALIFNPDNVEFLDEEFLQFFETSDNTFLKVLK